jgi:hypothetical protein
MQDTFDSVDISPSSPLIDAIAHPSAACSPPKLDEFSYPFVIVGPDTSFHVLEMDAGFLQLFSFKQEEMRRSLRIIAGPRTDTKALKFLFECCRDGINSTKSFTFYQKNGDEFDCRVRAMSVSVDGSVAAKLMFETQGCENVANFTDSDSLQSSFPTKQVLMPQPCDFPSHDSFESS